MAKYHDIDFDTKEKISEFLSIADIGHLIFQTDSGFFINVSRDNICNIYKSTEIPEEVGGAYDLCRKDIESEVLGAGSRLIWGKIDDESFLIEGYIL